MCTQHNMIMMITMTVWEIFTVIITETLCFVNLLLLFLYVPIVLYHHHRLPAALTSWRVTR